VCRFRKAGIEAYYISLSPGRVEVWSARDGRSYREVKVRTRVKNPIVFGCPCCCVLFTGHSLSTLYLVRDVAGYADPVTEVRRRRIHNTGCCFDVGIYN
jgi:hypothetical protein